MVLRRPFQRVETTNRQPILPASFLVPSSLERAKSTPNQNYAPWRWKNDASPSIVGSSRLQSMLLPANQPCLCLLRFVGKCSDCRRSDPGRMAGVSMEHESGALLEDKDPSVELFVEDINWLGSCEGASHSVQVGCYQMPRWCT